MGGWLYRIHTGGIKTSIDQQFHSSLSLESRQLLCDPFLVECVDGVCIHSLGFVEVGRHPNGHIHESEQQWCRPIGESTEDSGQEEHHVDDRLASMIFCRHPLPLVSMLEKNILISMFREKTTRKAKPTSHSADVWVCLPCMQMSTWFQLGWCWSWHCQVESARCKLDKFVDQPAPATDPQILWISGDSRGVTRLQGG